jgi:GT2 family glycosyltransferase
MAVRKADFERVGGFPAGVKRGQDSILFFRLRQAGLEQRFASEAEVGHFNHSGFREFAKHQFMMGQHFIASRMAAGRRHWWLTRWFFPVIWAPKCAVVMGRLFGAHRAPRPNPFYHFPGVLVGSVIFAVGLLRSQRRQE